MSFGKFYKATVGSRSPVGLARPVRTVFLDFSVVVDPANLLKELLAHRSAQVSTLLSESLADIGPELFHLSQNRTLLDDLFSVGISEERMAT